MEEKAAKSKLELLQKSISFALAMALLFYLFANQASGTSWRTPTAIESNLLAFDGKLAFIQGSGGLTVLDLQTGKVQLRKLLEGNLRYARRLVECPSGVLFVGYSEATLCDAVTFKPSWTIEGSHSIVVEGHYIISSDGNRTVRCHDSTTGEERWSQEIRGGWQLTACGNVVTVASVAVDGGKPAFWVFDAESGRERYNTSPPPGMQWYKVHNDGEFIYAVTGQQDADGYQAIPQGILQFDLNGRELARLDLSSPKISRIGKWPHSPLTYNGKVFPQHENCRIAFPHEQTAIDHSSISENAFTSSLPSGLLIHEESDDAAGARGHVVRLLSGDNPWAAYLPYSRPNEWLEAVEQFRSRIVLCFSGGQIECLDVESGESQWLYMFPSFRRVLAASGCYIGDFWRSKEASQAEVFTHGLASLGTKTGSIRISDDKKPENTNWPALSEANDYIGLVSIDPAPNLRFEALPGRLTRTRILLGTLFLPFVLLLAWRRHWLVYKTTKPDERLRSARRHNILFATCGFAVFVIATAGLYMFGQVSSVCNLLYWGIALTSLVLSWNAVARATEECSTTVQFVSSLPIGLLAGIAIGFAAIA